MLSELHSLRDTLKASVAVLDIDVIDGPLAKKLVVVFAEIERVAAAGKALAMAGVESSGAWTTNGAASPAVWLANVAGTSIGAAHDTLMIGRSVEMLPETNAALRSGNLSAAQATEVVRAAIKDPDSEQKLLESARRDGLAGVKRESARVVAAARDKDDQAAVAKRQRALRSLHFFRDAEGMECGSWRLEPKVGIVLRRRLEKDANSFFNAARKLGVRDTPENYLADALADLMEPARTSQPRTDRPVDTSATRTEDPETPSMFDTDHETADTPEPTADRPRTDVHVEINVVVDYEPLLRGYLLPGERCEIPGVGPIPIEQAREYLLGGAFLKVLIAKGIDIRTVCHMGRNYPAELTTALKYRDPVCAIAGCERTKGLERHHVQAIAKDGQTSLFNIRRVCDHHHDLFTHHGYTLGPPDDTGKCQLIPPTNPPPKPPPREEQNAT